MDKKDFKKIWYFIWEALHDKVLILLIISAIVSVGTYWQNQELAIRSTIIVLGVIPGISEDPESGWIEGVAIMIAVVIVVMVTAINDLQKDRQFRALNARKNDRCTFLRFIYGLVVYFIPLFSCQCHSQWIKVSDISV